MTPVIVPQYDWEKFAGSPEALKWSRRDLPNLAAVTERVPMRRVAVQAGGCLGVYPKFLASCFDVVYTFEPSAHSFLALCRNAPEPNVIKFQAALGDSHAGVRMAQVRRDKPRAIPHEGITHVAGPGAVPTLRVDDFEWPACDLLQLDLEGWEVFALRGAQATIKRCRPVLCVEVNRNGKFAGFTKDDLRAEIVGMGYTFVERLQSDEVYVPAEAASA